MAKEVTIRMPEERIAKDAVKVWLIRDAIGNIIIAAVLAGLYVLNDYYTWPYWAAWLLYGLFVVFIAGLVWSFIHPYLQYRNWRYDVDEEFLYLKEGALFESYTMIPLTKVQAVSMKQGLLLRRYRLATVRVATVGESYDIPALPIDRAMDVQRRIAQLAKVKEVEQPV